MLFRRIFISALIALARNPTVKKKTAIVTGKVLNAARPTLLIASRKAGEFHRKLSQKIEKS
jgi:hypothetical protein